jgi:hypothetical protein
VQAFARLLDALSFQPARNGKLRADRDLLAQTPDPDRGWALAALTGGLDFPRGQASPCCAASAERRSAPSCSPFHTTMSATWPKPLALIWDTEPTAGPPPTLSEPWSRPCTATRTQTPAILKRWLDALDSTGRWALLKAADRGDAGRRLGAAGQAGGRQASATSRSMTSRRSGTGWPRPTGRCSTGCCTARRAPLGSNDRPRPSCRPCWPTRSKAPNSTRSIPRISETCRMEMGRHPRAGRASGGP